MPETSPLIVTLLLDKKSFNFFNELRRKYFPRAQNFLLAHLTLFHHLPADQLPIKNDLSKWSEVKEPFPLRITELKMIGKGVAFKVESDALLTLHAAMQRQWQPWLTLQDKQKIWPHITIQNKVTPAIAKQTLAVLQRTFEPFVEGLPLWSYENGPWKFIQEFRFSGSGMH